MLSIGKLVGVGYYLDSVARRVEDYYAGRGEAAGWWVGSGAAELGLSGTVEAGEILPLLAGCGPDGAALLAGKAAAEGRLPGFDLTFSAPKSVSLLAALGDGVVAGAVRAAHEAAVVQAVGYLEAEAARVRRGRNGLSVLAAEGLVGAAFGHRSSRAGDPQVHTHVLVMNLARGSDGRWSALDGRPLFAYARTAGFLYQAALRAGLTRALGVGWGPVRQGAAEVAGFGAGELREFSRRRVEIVGRMAELGTSSARGAQAAALATRQAKSAGERFESGPLRLVNARDYGVEPPSLVEEWRVRGAALGLDGAWVAGLTGPGREPAGLAEGLVAGLVAADGLTGRASSFDRRDVLRALAAGAAEGAEVAVLAAAASRFLAGPDLVVLEGGAAGLDATATLRLGDGGVVVAGTGVRYTTAELLAVETVLLEGAARRRSAGVGQVGAEALSAALSARPSLSDEQRVMVERLVTSGAGVEVVVGAAGTGKTTALDAARAAWEAAGVVVVGAALSARAASELSAGAGIEAVTIARLLLDAGRPRWEGGGLVAGSVVVVDEASMVGTRTLARLAELAEAAAAKLVVVGDTRQLPEIDAGGAFRGLQDRLGAVHLTENRRQREVWERDALAALRAGRVAEAVAAYGEQGRIHLAPSAEAAMAAMCADWWAARRSGEEAVMLAARREAIARLNGLARALRVDAGEVAGVELVAGERRFAVGDEVVGTRNDRRLGILNGDLGRVSAVDVGEGTVTVAVAGRGRRRGREVVVPGSYAERHLDYAYALTGYKAQGLTTDRTFSLGDDGMSAEMGYTTLSRGRVGNDLYWVVPDRAEDVAAGRDPLDELRRGLSRSRGQRLATDSLGEVAALAGAHSVAELQHQILVLGMRLRGELPPDRAELIASDRVWVEMAAAELEAARRRRLAAEAGLAAEPRRRGSRRASKEAERRAAAQGEDGWERRLATRQAALAELEAGQDRRQRWVADHAADLGRYAQLQEAVTRRSADLVRAAVLRPPTWLTETLGVYPADRAGRRVWRETAREILVYRDRYNERDPARVLGPEPADVAQRYERRRVAQYIPRARRVLGLQAGRDPLILGQEPNRDRGWELGFGP